MLPVILVSCDVPSDTLKAVPLAPTPTGAPILLEVSSCDMNDFDHNPNIEDRLSIYIEEPTHLRGVIDITSGTSVEPTIYLENSKYILQGQDFGNELQRRIIEVYGQVDPENEGIFLVKAFEAIPYAVLIGQLWIREYVCREQCHDFLLFDVEQNGKTYTFSLSTYSNMYPKLWELAGSQVSLAADILSGPDYLDYYRLNLRFLCK